MYHTLERPVFWYPLSDWSVPYFPDVRKMLAGLYPHLMCHHHSKIMPLRATLVRHKHFVKKLGSNLRERQARRIVRLLDHMLQHRPCILEAPPFGLADDAW